jgi:hypothetical protein
VDDGTTKKDGAMKPPLREMSWEVGVDRCYLQGDRRVAAKTAGTEKEITETDCGETCAVDAEGFA